MAWTRDRWCLRELAILCAIAILPRDAIVYGQSLPQGQSSATQQTQSFSPEQLDSLVAPVALYPDQL